MSISIKKSGSIVFGRQQITLGKGVWLKKEGSKRSLVLPLHRFNYARLNLFGKEMSFEKHPYYDGLPGREIINRPSWEAYENLTKYFYANKANLFNIYALDQMTRICFKLKKYDQVIEYCDIILEQKPDDNRALDRQGKAYLKKGMFEEAEDCFDRIVEKNDRDYPAWDGKGRANLEQKMYAEAERCFLKVYQKRPKDIRALDGLMQAAYEKGEYDKAESYAHELLKIAPDDQFATLNLQAIERIREEKSM